MTYVILKDRIGLPVALFYVERETPKRFYGRLADTLSLDKWFWLSGLTRGRIRAGNMAGTGQDFVNKDFVLCKIDSNNAWFAMKDRLLAIKHDHEMNRKVIDSELNDARERAATRQIELRASAEKLVKKEIAKYVRNTDML